jgi:hypothetical protein
MGEEELKYILQKFRMNSFVFVFAIKIKVSSNTDS